MLASPFLFCTCQQGAVAALKQEVARLWPMSRFSYSRPGFVTFKQTEGEFKVDELPPLVFARRAAVSLDKITGDHLDDMVDQLAAKWRQAQCDHLHIFGREVERETKQGSSPDREIEAALLTKLECDPVILQSAQPDKLVLNCLRVGEREWWLGVHRSHFPDTRWPGGIWPGEPAELMVSRAYLKMTEALDWSQLPLAAGDLVAEIGCAPGGASQLLLERGMQVLGIDPADVDPRVAGHPNFQHVKKRGADLKVREFRDVRWLVADLNVAPEYTLTTLDRIAAHKSVSFHGVVMNLKLLEWKLAEELPNYLKRVESWGFNLVLARQLIHNRQEVCVVGTRRKVMKRRRRLARLPQEDAS